MHVANRSIVLLLAAASALGPACGNGDGNGPAPATHAPSAATAADVREPNLGRYAGRWDAIELWGDAGQPLHETALLWHWLTLHDDGRFEAETHAIDEADPPGTTSGNAAAADDTWRAIAFQQATNDQVGLRVWSRGTWEVDWNPADRRVTLTLQFDRRSSRPRDNGRGNHGAAESDNGRTSAGPASGDANRTLTFQTELVGQRGRFLHLNGHPVRTDIARTVFERRE